MDTVRRYSMLFGGDWVDTDDRFEIRSPATEELVASVAKGGIEHADRAIGAAKAAHADGRWRRTPPQERAAVLEEKFVHLDLSGQLDRRAYALLLGTPPA
jgi:acyl-CoA reductase-like NAD-dependent aldehyde dehydrogenase